MAHGLHAWELVPAMELKDHEIALIAILLYQIIIGHLCFTKK